MKSRIVEEPLLDETECAILREYAEAKKRELLVDKALLREGSYEYISESQVTTALYNSYSVVGDHPWLAEKLRGVLLQSIPDLMWPVLIQSWANIYESGEGIDWHCHTGCDGRSYTANIFIGGDPDPGLLVGNYGCPTMTLKNKLGWIIIMKTSEPHCVPSNKSKLVRYSIGMTIHDFIAITPEVLSNVAINSRRGSIILN